MLEKEFREGDVVKVTTDGSIGIVTSQNQTFLNVLFHNYRCIPVKRTLITKTGKHIDLGDIWERVHDGDEKDNLSTTRASNIFVET